MQESKEPIERPDLFSSYLRERLEDHRMPVDADGWAGVEAALSRRRWLTVAGAVAAVLAGLVLLLPFHKDMPDVPRVADQPAAVAPMAAQPEEASPAEQPQTISPAVVQPARSRLLATTALPEEKTTVTAMTVSEIPVSTDETPEEEAPVEEQTPTAATEKKRVADVPADPNGYKAPADTYRRSPARSNKRSEWLVAAGFGTGSSVDMSIGGDYAPVFDNAEDPSSPIPGSPQGSFNSEIDKESPWMLDNGFLPSQFTDVTYHLPLSFGVTVRKNLTSHLAVESGLVYTYLRTSYSGGTQRLKEAEYRYHYIGVPINLVANLLNRPQWNLYLSGGIMGEKGVRGAREATYQNLAGPSYYQSSTFALSGLQWSVNASIGISYRLQRQWSLYAEPRFSYFFDNNQPETARTDHPVSLGIGGGIRFEF